MKKVILVTMALLAMTMNQAFAAGNATAKEVLQQKQAEIKDLQQRLQAGERRQGYSRVAISVSASLLAVGAIVDALRGFGKGLGSDKEMYNVAKNDHTLTIVFGSTTGASFVWFAVEKENIENLLKQIDDVQADIDNTVKQLN
jgi:hypothetical protein